MDIELNACNVSVRIVSEEKKMCTQKSRENKVSFMPNSKPNIIRMICLHKYYAFIGKSGGTLNNNNT